MTYKRQDEIPKSEESQGFIENDFDNIYFLAWKCSREKLKAMQLRFHLSRTMSPPWWKGNPTF